MISKSAVGNNSKIADKDTITNKESCEIPLEYDYTDLNTSGSSSLPFVGKKRKYDDNYISWGFTKVGSTDAPDAQCVVCHKILSNSSLVIAKLHRHLETNHFEHRNKEVNFFQRKLDIY